MDYFHIKEMLKQVGIIKEAEHQKPTQTTEPVLIPSNHLTRFMCF